MKNLQVGDSHPGRPGMQLLRLVQRVWQEEWNPSPGPGAARETIDGAPKPAADRMPPAPHRVLVVDDNPVNLMLASELLMTFGVVPMVAADGAEAVALAAELPLDFIMMDLQMPVLDGLSALRQIRNLEALHQRGRVPVVAYTSTAPALQMLLDCGFDGVLDKPCDHNALQQCLQRWCPQVLPQAAQAAQAGTPPAPTPRHPPWSRHSPLRGGAAGLSAPWSPPG